MSGEYRFLSTPSEMSGLRCFARNFRKLKIYSKKLSKRHLQNYFNGKQYKVIQRRRQDFFGGGASGTFKGYPAPENGNEVSYFKTNQIENESFFQKCLHFSGLKNPFFLKHFDKLNFFTKISYFS